MISVMKGRIVALIVLLLVYLSQIEAQGQQYGEANQRQIAAQYKGEWKLVVGAKAFRPIINLGNGETKSLSSNAILSFPKKDRVLPLAGEINLVERVEVNPYPYPNQNIRSVVLKFIPQQDFDNLYVALFLMTKDSELIGIRVKEIGKVKAGKTHRMSYEYIFKQHEKAPEVRFYSKGLEVKTTKKGIFYKN